MITGYPSFAYACIIATIAGDTHFEEHFSSLPSIEDVVFGYGNDLPAIFVSHTARDSKGYSPAWILGRVQDSLRQDGGYPGASRCAVQAPRPVSSSRTGHDVGKLAFLLAPTEDDSNEDQEMGDAKIKSEMELEFKLLGPSETQQDGEIGSRAEHPRRDCGRASNTEFDDHQALVTWLKVLLEKEGVRNVKLGNENLKLLLTQEMQQKKFEDMEKELEGHLDWKEQMKKMF
ncbi:hypothetical protein SVAN01_08670 [Stagonosporopsis vannaccii]|nr:hypothetical protein SVAN01_08670 [Stagonosporopsis vannaccii]